MKYWILGLLSLFSTTFANDLPGIYSAITPLPFDSHGWFINEKPLDEIFRSKKIYTVIELGSWIGASTRFLAFRVEEGGRVYAVDTWLGTQSNQHQMRDRRVKNLYKLFLSNVIHMGLTDRIVPIKMTTDEAAKFMDVKADLIYVDADDTTYQVERDVLNWYPHLRKGGILCGNDWAKKSVRKGVKAAALQLNKNIEVDSKGNFWYLN